MLSKITKPTEAIITVLEKTIVTAELAKITIASESKESADITREEPGALVAVVVVFVVVGVVVFVEEEKIEPDATSVDAGVNKT